MANNVEIAKCYFCGKSKLEVNALIAGRSGAKICDECVANCVLEIARGLKEAREKSGGDNQ